ncbi:Isy1-like splicing factor [Entophlyctis helioformis]|nr:Isy1-like splicing factor [Entophlyctis helioformis]
MARNEEKAQSMLYRFREAQRAEFGASTGKFDKRPRSAMMVDDLKEAEKWRRDLLREMARKLDRIKDESLTEFQVRDLNDEINKMLREKRQWEYRVRDLGGTDYLFRKGIYEIEGEVVPGTKGYRYFGRAKTLPGIKELFEKAAIEQVKLKPEDVWYRVDFDYFGYRDEDDELLLEFELAQEAEVKEKIKRDYGDQDAANLDLTQMPTIEPPSQAQVEAWLLRRRKQELAEKYLAVT